MKLFIFHLGGHPVATLLKKWDQKDNSAEDLFDYLDDMDLVPAMKTMKKYVPKATFEESLNRKSQNNNSQKVHKPDIEVIKKFNYVDGKLVDSTSKEKQPILFIRQKNLQKELIGNQVSTIKKDFTRPKDNYDITALQKEVGHISTTEVRSEKPTCDFKKPKDNYDIKALFLVVNLEKINFAISPSQKHTPRNGNGFIHALIDQMKYDPLLQHTNFTHTKLRQEIVQTLPKMIEKGLVQDWTLGQPLDLSTGSCQSTPDSPDIWMTNMSKEGTSCDDIFIRLAELYLNRKIVVHSLPTSNEEDHLENGGDTEFSAFEPLHVLITSTNEHKKYYQSIRPKSSTNIKWKRTLASRSNQEQNFLESNSSESGPIKRTRYNSGSHQPPEVIFCEWKHSDVEEACNG